MAGRTKKTFLRNQVVEVMRKPWPVDWEQASYVKPAGMPGWHWALCTFGDQALVLVPARRIRAV